MHIYIMRGLPGSGKSTWVKNFRANHPDANIVVVSADDYFVDSDGVYRFNPARLGAAHGQCKNRYDDALRQLNTVDYIIVDNTNTTTKEIEYYWDAARSRGIPVSIVEIAGDVDECAKRNVHGVPREALVRMAGRLALGLSGEMKEATENE